MEEKISIIIPAYNIESYLPRTLESVLEQTYTNLEIIVVDDGSKDSTGKVIDEYAQKDSRIRAIHQKNGGVTSARMRGVEESSGEWIGFVDGDDFIDVDMYERLLANAIKYNADISHCGYQMVFPDGHIDYYHNTGTLIQHNQATALKELISGRTIEPGLWNKLFRKSLVRDFFDSEVMDADVKINEDLLMNYYLFKLSSRSVFEDFCPYHYVLRKGSAATGGTNAHKLYDPIKVTKIIQNDCDEFLSDVIYSRLVHQLIAGATMKLGNQAELIRPFCKKCCTELRNNLSKILFRSSLSLKLKIMAVWASTWPASYAFVHQVYERLTGLDKIYNLD